MNLNLSNQNKNVNNNMFLPSDFVESGTINESGSASSSNLRKMTSIQNLNEDGGSEDHNLDFEEENSEEIDEIMFGFVNSDDYQLSLSSPSSLNSDDCVYAYRGRIEIMPNNNHENHLNFHQNGAGIMPNENQQNEQDNEETDDFLEMDFDPETNSEIENDPQSDALSNGNHQGEANGHQEGSNGWAVPHLIEDPQKTVKNTGTKPKIPTFSKFPVASSSSSSSTSRSRHLVGGEEDRLHINNNYYNNSSTSNYCLEAHSSSFTFNLSNNHNNHINNNNLDCLSNGSANNLLLNDNQFCNLSMENQLNNNHFKYHQNYNYLENNHHHFCNDRLLLDIEPHKPRNSVTIYTTNCDEKILVDALTSLNLEPNRELISSYFHNLVAQSSATETNLINYVINKSKLNCNYKGLIELIEKCCRNEDDERYGEKKFDINFYTLDLFSNEPEMIEINVNEIVKRWTPNTNLRLLAQIKNKYFHQTNVLGKIVNIVRKSTNESTVKIKDSDTIKIPQFYKSGYITITLLK